MGTAREADELVYELEQDTRDDSLRELILSSILYAGERTRLAIRGRPDFEYRDQRLKYFVGRHLTTWRNERTVEIPIAEWHLAQHPAGRVLEVGNVISHYRRVEHTVLDKYEARSGVVNEDLLEYEPVEPFEFLLSISTFEHIGWNDATRRPDLVIDAFRRVPELISDDGGALVTVPVGWNSRLDRALAEGELAAFKIEAFTREAFTYDWRQSDLDTALGRSYGDPWVSANALVVLTLNA